MDFMRSVSERSTRVLLLDFLFSLRWRLVTVLCHSREACLWPRAGSGNPEGCEALVSVHPQTRFWIVILRSPPNSGTRKNLVAIGSLEDSSRSLSWATRPEDFEWASVELVVDRSCRRAQNRISEFPDVHELNTFHKFPVGMAWLLSSFSIKDKLVLRGHLYLLSGAVIWRNTKESSEKESWTDSEEGERRD